MARAKSYNIKVYGQDGTTVVGNISLPPEKSFPTFSSRINGVYAECVLDLNYPFDDFDEGGLVDFMNIVGIDVCDAAYPLGRILYKGYISRYEPYIIGGG
jgi:hypothetical protein